VNPPEGSAPNTVRTTSSTLGVPELGTGIVFSGAMAAFAIVYFLAFRGRGRKGMRAAVKDTPHFRLGAMAQQMGLTVVEGDPETSLVYAIGVHRAKKLPVSATFGSHTTTTRLRMAGNPDGRHTEFLFFAETHSEWVGGTRMAGRMAHSTDFDCRLAVQLPVAVPPFEVVLRKEIRGLEAEPRLGLPRQPFGSRDLDARLVLMASDPRLGAVLAPAAIGMTQFESLHIVGQGAVLYYVTGENASSTALYRLVEAQRILYALSDVLTGASPAPGPPYPPPGGDQAHWS
jgi:hypothetical protein